MQKLRKVLASLLSRTSVKKSNTNSSTPSKEDEPLKELVESNPIKGTPLHIIGNKEKGYFIAFGKWRITEPFPTVQAVKQHFTENQMNITIQIVSIIIDNVKELNRNQRDTIKNNKLTAISHNQHR